jgi:hypothetical protein
LTPEPVWTGTENLATTGIRSPDRLPRSELLYRLSYSGPHSRFLVAYIHIYVIKGEPRNRPRRTHRVSGGIAQLFLNLGTRRGCVVSITPRPPLPPGKTGTPCTGGWVGPGAGLDRCGKSRPTGIRSPDLPARSESLYRLSYPGSIYIYVIRF